MMKSDNLVVFPKAKRHVTASAIPDVTPVYRGPVRRNVQFLPWNLTIIVACLRAVVLALLLFFRPLVFVVCRPLAGLALIACMIAFAADANDERLKYGFGIFSFGAFLVMHLYDGLLMLLSRGNIVNILN
jgi:hypothetical protein